MSMSCGATKGHTDAQGLGYILLVSEGWAATGATVSFGPQLLLRATPRSMDLFYCSQGLC